MKTSELIKQAEEILRVHDNAFTNETDEAIIAAFARNHMQEFIDRLKKYEEAFQNILNLYIYENGTIDGNAINIVYDVLGEG